MYMHVLYGAAQPRKGRLRSFHDDDDDDDSTLARFDSRIVLVQTLCTCLHWPSTVGRPIFAMCTKYLMLQLWEWQVSYHIARQHTNRVLETTCSLMWTTVAPRQTFFQFPRSTYTYVPYEYIQKEYL